MTRYINCQRYQALLLVCWNTKKTKCVSTRVDVDDNMLKVLRTLKISSPFFDCKASIEEKNKVTLLNLDSFSKNVNSLPVEVHVNSQMIIS